MFLEDLKYLGEVSQAVLFLVDVDYHVVDVGIHDAPHQVPKHLGDRPLVSVASTFFNPKGLVTKNPLRSDEGCLFLV